MLLQRSTYRALKEEIAGYRDKALRAVVEMRYRLASKEREMELTLAETAS